MSMGAEKGADFMQDYIAGWSDCLQEIAKIPNAGAKPIARVQWKAAADVQNNGNWYCLVCYTHVDFRTNYCPTCRANMTKEN